jgi:arylsulfatase A-like enzyme
MSRPNIVLLTIDSLRADHLGCYGYAKNTSPHIDAMAAESVVFDRAFAPGIPTMPSFTTLLSGTHPYRHGITAHASEQRVREDLVMMPQLAKQAGYVTIAIDNLATQANGRGSWFSRGFDYYSSYLYKPFSDQGEQLANRALKFIDDFQERPFLLWLHLWDPHSPYNPPEPYKTAHYTPGGEAGRQQLEAVKQLAPEYYEEFLGDMKHQIHDDYNYVVAQYDGEISYMDAQIGRIVERLKALNLWENSLVILMSDHGEAFGEGGIHFDHHGLYDAVTRVSQIWHVPGVEAGRRQAMISTEDILATLAEAGGWQLPPYEITGRSFWPVVQGRSTSHRDWVVHIESTRQASLALRTERWKLIQPIPHDARGAVLPDIYGNQRGAKVLLYDLQNDPAESHDVGDEHPEVRAQLQQQLNDWRAAEVTRRGGDDPLLENGLSLGYHEFMERLLSRKLRG